ncbi:Lrp/AsnC family transcriptional regulator [Nocardia arthritidis]|uniref:AsnC family transcriptional regulator n=1 Tax=Nocardia arthritidis TaxID=228602 RepID=A0A6G9YLL5_9NOCA|nr:Lrp/AsnC family transcriptional regulator [Nocardia arthritidis]QIS14098.1 AsnC family transcriptional regulator [Nocardia arthritidis]
MSQHLEETDRRIVTALVADPRVSWRELAQRLDLSERTVVRRAVPLYEKGIVRASAMRNLACFPQLRVITLRLKCARERVGALAEALARRPDTRAVDVISGGGEIFALLYLDNAQERDALLLRDIPATAAVITWEAQRVMRVFPSVDPAHPPLPGELNLGFGMPEPERPVKLLDVDEAIIEALSRNGRASYTELAGAAGVTAHTARRRLVTLLDEHVVRPVTIFDLSLVGLESQSLLWLSVRPGALDTIGRRLAVHPDVFCAAAITGPANLLLAVAKPTFGDIYAFVTDTVGVIPEVTNVETSAILATIKRPGHLRPTPWARARGARRPTVGVHK